jgi:cytoskeletal protein RodZ
MKSLGEYLQAERQTRGISLEQISADTRISISMLKAIEEGNTEKLPAPVLVKGFLRAYAGNIGLDPEAVIIKYQDLVEEADPRQEALEKFHRRLRPKSSRKKGLMFLFVLVVLAALAFISWHFYSGRQQQKSPVVSESSPGLETPRDASQTAPPSAARQEQPAPAAPAASTAASPPESEAKAEPEIAPVEPESEAMLPVEGGPAAVSADRAPAVSQPGSDVSLAETEQQVLTPPPAAPVHVLRARAVERTWLSITIDETRVREYLLRPGQEMEWRARSSLNVIIGNAAGVQLYLNERPLKPLGERGKVVNLTLPDPSLFSAAESE